MLNLKYYKGADQYCDGDIEQYILDQLDAGLTTQELICGHRQWPILYHFTPQRHNLLNWYSFNTNDSLDKTSLLEIGSGMGAMTGLFSEKVNQVHCVDLSKLRSEINLKRHKHLNNIDYTIGHFLDIPFDQKFDYITLIGVLEYTRSFVKEESPYQVIFKRIRQLMHEKSVLIIAIENRLGLKYFSGIPEDHTSTYFEGLEGYPINAIETFGRYELADLLKESGFTELEFYYPYPDYKLAQQVFSDDFLPELGQISDPSAIYHKIGLDLFNEAKTFNWLIKNKLFKDFSNSFLVFASIKDLH